MRDVPLFPVKYVDKNPTVSLQDILQSGRASQGDLWNSCWQVVWAKTQPELSLEKLLGRLDSVAPRAYLRPGFLPEKKLGYDQGTDSLQ